MDQDPVIPCDLSEAIDILFASYHMANPAWGSLHIVLDDGNLEDRHVDFCIQYAAENRDAVGHALAVILRSMSIEERDAISRRT